MMHRLLALMIAMSFSALVHAGPKEDAQAAFEKFYSSFVAGNDETVAALFTPDALFYGTSSPELVTNPEGVRQYFNRALSGPATVKATLLRSSALVLSDNVVLISGMWQSERLLDGKSTVNGPLRISVVMSKRGDRWLVAQFHNSPTPKPPAAAPTAPPSR